MTRHFTLSPTDSWFFRDGRPFNQDDEGQATAHSLFPPFPPTLTGAFRFALALGQSWRPAAGESWAKEPALKSVLGDGPDDLGRLNFGAPVLLRRRHEGGTAGGSWEPLHPAPLHLLGKSGGERFARLVPSALPPIRCDLGAAVRLPVLWSKIEKEDRAGWKPLDKVWLTHDGLQAVLDGGVPPADQIVRSGDLWKNETRVGLARDNGKRTATTGMLYMATHVRLARDVALGVAVEGIPNGWMPAAPVPFGGESRTAWIEETSVRPAPPRAKHLESRGGKTCYTVTLLSPWGPPDKGWRTPGGTLHPALPGTVVAACVERPVLIGGWDGRRGPRPLRAFLPAGSTWFIEADRSELDLAGLPDTIAEKPDHAHGFGRIAIGNWDPDDAKRCPKETTP